MDNRESFHLQQLHHGHLEGLMHVCVQCQGNGESRRESEQAQVRQTMHSKHRCGHECALNSERAAACIGHGHALGVRQEDVLSVGGLSPA